jgi:4-amino-4-deoxy-L-arabinose transferase-like glycosyltransferase
MKSDRTVIVILTCAALILYTYNLGELPLRDWDEGIVAGVARNIWRGTPDSNVWLYPTINYDRPYWNKPPLIHWSIAIVYRWFGVSEWTTRLVPALLSALSVPLLYKLARDILPTATGAIFSALVYLTLLPMVRHGRLAMLDGAIACWFILTFWCLLRSYNRPRYFLGVGIGLGLTCLTKGMMMGVLLGAIATILLLWDAPKLLKNAYLWLAIVLGVLPAIAWYLLQYWHYGEQFLGVSLGEQTFNRIWQPIGFSSPPWYYILEILKYTFPWLLFLLRGMAIAISQKDSSWAKLALIWFGIYLTAISLMVSKLPWYIIPIYPVFSLLVGVNLADLWQGWGKKGRRNEERGTRNKKSFISGLESQIISLVLALLAIAIWSIGIFYNYLNLSSDRSLLPILLALATTLTVAAILLWLKSRYFIIVLVLGLYSSYLLFFHSQLWIWELSEAFPVREIAQTIQQHTPARQIIYTSHSALRPSLEFYSDRVILPASDTELKQYWQEQNVYFLLDSAAIARLDFDRSQIVGNSVTWQLSSDRTNPIGETWQLVTKSK